MSLPPKQDITLWAGDTDAAARMFTFAAAALPAFDFAEPFFVALVARPLSGYDAAAELPSENFAVTAGGGKVTIAADFSPFFGCFRAAGYSLKISQSGRVRTLCHGTITMVGE